MLNTAIWRPLMSMSLRVPAGNSRHAAITCLAMVLRGLFGETAVGRQRIVAPDLAVQLLWDSWRHDVVAVELPVRKVGRKQQHVVGLHVLDQFCHRGRIVRAVEWLDGQPDVIAHNFSRRTIDPRHFEAYAAPEF